MEKLNLKVVAGRILGEQEIVDGLSDGEAVITTGQLTRR
jgi:hypothetical protein